jgi:hypothetical protein
MIDVERPGYVPARRMRLSVLARRMFTTERLAWLLPVAACLVAVAIVAPRFAITSPSLVDDWFQLTYAPVAMHEILHGHFDSAAVDYAGRYRPSFYVLSYAQWPLVGSRTSTTGPTLVALARLFLFIGAVAALTVFFVREYATRKWLLGMAGSVPLLGITTPGMVPNFVRFGVAEPTSFAAIARSLCAITIAVRRLVAGSDKRTRTLLLFAGGYLLYLFGVYMWEASAAVLLVLPAIYFWLARDPQLRIGRLWATKTIVTTAVLLVLPLVHILLEVHSALGGGGSSSLGELPAKLGSSAAGTLWGTIFGLKSFNWAVLFVVVVVYCVRRARGGDRHAVLCVGMLAAGLLAAYLSYLGGGGLSRYYVPWLVAVGVAGAWATMQLDDGGRRLFVLAAMAVVTLIGRPDAYLQSWVEGDRAGSDAISLASSAYATGCRVYLVGFPGERRIGLARLLRNPTAPATRAPCQQGARPAFAVTWGSSTTAPLVGCRTNWRAATQRRHVTLFRCADFHPRSSIPTQDIDLEAPVDVVRLVKPSHFVPASALHKFTILRHRAKVG